MFNVKKYHCRVLEVVNPVEFLYSVVIESLSGSFHYLPGQFLHLSMDPYDPSFGWPESRCFSFMSNPSEAIIKITFTIKGSFTTRMANELKPGKEIYLKMPFGDFLNQKSILHDSVFIAGGTGICPYLSLFTNQSFRDFTGTKLYFGAKSKEYNIYFEDLSKAKEINPGFEAHFIYENEEGFLNINEIYQRAKTGSSFVLSGPPQMITDFKTKLITWGVALTHIFVDEWE